MGPVDEHPDPDSRPGGADSEMENYVTSVHDLYWDFYPGGVPFPEGFEPPEPYLT